MKEINMEAKQQKSKWTIENIMDLASMVLMAVLVFIPFAISFGSLQDLSLSNHVSIPFLFPLLVDGAQLIFKVLVIRASLYGRTDIYSWVMAGVMMVISVLLNVAHVPDESTRIGFNYYLAGFMNALPPILIFTAFIAIAERIKESVVNGRMLRTYEQLKEQLSQIKKEISTAEQAKNEANESSEKAQKTAKNEQEKIISAAAEREQLEAERDQLKEGNAQLKEEKEQLREEIARLRKRVQEIKQPNESSPARQPVLMQENVGDKEAAFLAYVKDNPEASLRQIGAAIGVASPSTVQNYQKKLEGAGRLSKNGHWTVLGE